MRKPILYLDFETSPIIGTAWTMYETTLGYILADVKIISVAWSWEGEDKVYALSIPDFAGHKAGWLNVDDRKLVEAFIPIFSKAEIIVAHNGKGFDFKLWRTRLIVHGFQPPQHVDEWDTKTFARKFRFTNNRQDNISRQLGTERKLQTGGEHLWYLCINENDPKAWAKMIRYNKQDVRGLKDNAHRLIPWVENTTNANVINKTMMQCTNPLCGSTLIGENGFRYTKTGRTKRFKCKVCGRGMSGPHLSSGAILR